MDCIKAVRLEQEDNLLIWEKKGQFGQGFCMVGENGWNDISAENISMDDWNKMNQMQKKNYDSYNEQGSVKDKYAHDQDNEPTITYGWSNSFAIICG